MEIQSVLLKKLLLQMAQKKASSLHLSVGSSPMMRIYGRLISIDEEGVLKRDDIEKVIQSFIEEEEILKLKEKKEILLVKDFGENFRFRVNIFFQKNNLSISFNYISEEIRELDSLGLPEMFKKNVSSNSGLLIVAGPNDSGRTSTIASFIEKINSEEKKFGITLEEPIERFFVNKQSMIDQRQIGTDVNSYIDGLKHCLEEDVDFVYIDEIKDNFEEALPHLLELASGNCLVIVEINGESSIRVLEKILNTNCRNLSRESIRFLLADVLLGIIVQRLIPNQSGELSLAVEALMSNFAVKSLIRDGKIYQLESIIQNSSEEGTVSMERSIKELIISGKVDPRDVNNFNLGI